MTHEQQASSKSAAIDLCIAVWQLVQRPRHMTSGHLINNLFFQWMIFLFSKKKKEQARTLKQMVFMNILMDFASLRL